MRACGPCRLCCTTHSIVELEKPAGVRCQYVNNSCGCTIYSTRPQGCRVWECAWLQAGRDGTERAFPGNTLPDKTHVVVDLVQAGGWTVMQLHCDPKHPRAHLRPRFQQWLQALAPPLPVLLSRPDLNPGGMCFEVLHSGGLFKSQAQASGHYDPRTNLITVSKEETEVNVKELKVLHAREAALEEST